MPELDDRFLSKTRLCPETGCILWTGALSSDGYGAYTDGKQYRAHRYIYMCTYGDIPEGLLVMHTCDTPRCVNIDHLQLGTHKDNSQDMVKKNRVARHFGNAYSAGRNPPNAVLSDDQVREIREMYTSGCRQWKIARYFDVAQQTVSQVVTGTRYSRVA